MQLSESSMLQGKTALVTGSTSGIGLGLALKLAEQGANLILNGFGDFQSAISAVTAHGVPVHYHPADMSRPEEIEAMMQFAAEHHGGVDILVNNAGVQHVANVEDFPVEKWNSILAINLSSAFHTTRLAIPYMKSKQWGRILNIASAHGLIASAQKSAYVAAKHGLVGFTKSVALEVATTGITVNAICPGWVLTPLVDKQIKDRSALENIPYEQAQKELLQEKQPSLQFTTVEQLGDLAVFLCSQSAVNVQGVAWQVDGGWTAR